jgi:hypothetical protein
MKQIEEINVHNKMEWMWKEMVVVYFSYYPWNVLEV